MKSLDNNYNQVVANYYETENDYIPYHRDWTNGMVNNYEISTITLNHNNNNITRTFEIVPNMNVVNNSKYDKINIELYNGLIVTMGGECQERFRHGIPKISNNKIENKRFGLTFRQFTK
jgi:alkylated DNA repair dioxygenase AlkB